MFDFLKKNKKAEEKMTEFDIYAIAEGELIAIDQVNDPVFSQKMMGDGFAIIPSNTKVVAPSDGEILNVFPSKHAIAIKNGEVEILIHLGIDTVTLEGAPFNVLIQEGDVITSGAEIVEVDVEQIKQAEKDPVMIVIFTNGNDTIESMEITHVGPVKKGDKIGKIVLK